MHSFLHSGKIGDCIAAIPTVKALGGGHIYLNSMPFSEFQWSAADSLLPLLNAQPGIKASHADGRLKVDYNLDLFRHISLDLSAGSIPRWYFYVFDVHPDLTVPWL